jgi:hypothetical protein
MLIPLHKTKPLEDGEMLLLNNLFLQADGENPNKKHHPEVGVKHHLLIVVVAVTEVVEEIEVAKEELVLPFKKVTAQEVTHVSFLTKLVEVQAVALMHHVKSVKTFKWEDVLEILVDSSMKVQVLEMAEVRVEVVVVVIIEL